jgi:hypothetical protein
MDMGMVHFRAFGDVDAVHTEGYAARGGFLDKPTRVLAAMLLFTV